MTGTSIARYFPFSRVKLDGLSVTEDLSGILIALEPDLRYTPICWKCNGKASEVHDYAHRAIRDLNLASARVFLNCKYRKVVCERCGAVRVEYQSYAEPYARVTRRLARYVYYLCQQMTVQRVAGHLGLNGKTVAKIEQSFQEKDSGSDDYEGLRILAIDRILLRRDRGYTTVVLDHESGRVAWMGDARKKRALSLFFASMTLEERERIEAVSVEVWGNHVEVVRKWCPHTDILVDLSHVAKPSKQVIGKAQASPTAGNSPAPEGTHLSTKPSMQSTSSEIT